MSSSIQPRSSCPYPRLTTRERRSPRVERRRRKARRDGGTKGRREGGEKGRRGGEASPRVPLCPFVPTSRPSLLPLRPFVPSSLRLSLPLVSAATNPSLLSRKSSIPSSHSPFSARRLPKVRRRQRRA